MDKRQDFQVWIDADACPKVIKEILFRAAQRLEFQLTLVANHALSTPPSPHIRALQVSSGFDVADDYIVEHVCAGGTIGVPHFRIVFAGGMRRPVALRLGNRLGSHNLADGA